MDSSARDEAEASLSLPTKLMLSQRNVHELSFPIVDVEFGRRVTHIVSSKDAFSKETCVESTITIVSGPTWMTSARVSTNNEVLVWLYIVMFTTMSKYVVVTFAELTAVENIARMTKRNMALIESFFVCCCCSKT